jgi:hypothetical protein
MRETDRIEQPSTSALMTATCLDLGSALAMTYW